MSLTSKTSIPMSFHTLSKKNRTGRFKTCRSNWWKSVALTSKNWKRSSCTMIWRVLKPSGNLASSKLTLKKGSYLGQHRVKSWTKTTTCESEYPSWSKSSRVPKMKAASSDSKLTNIAPTSKVFNWRTRRLRDQFKNWSNSSLQLPILKPTRWKP